jgi:hypothetical protein
LVPATITTNFAYRSITVPSKLIDHLVGVIADTKVSVYVACLTPGGLVPMTAIESAHLGRDE